MRSSRPSLQYAKPRLLRRATVSPRAPSSRRYIHRVSPVTAFERDGIAPGARCEKQAPADHQRRRFPVELRRRSEVLRAPGPGDMQFFDVRCIDLGQRRVLRAGGVRAIIAPFGGACSLHRRATEIGSARAEPVRGKNIRDDVGILAIGQAAGIVGGHGAARAVEKVGGALALPLGEERGPSERRRTFPTRQIRPVASCALFAISRAAAVGLGGGEDAVPCGAGLSQGGGGEQRPQERTISSHQRYNYLTAM